MTIAHCIYNNPSLLFLMRHFKGLGFQGVSPTLEGAEGVCSQCENHMVFSIAYPFNQSQEPPRCMNAEDRDPQCPVRGIR